MVFSLRDVLDAVGPTASLIFAALIFLSFLQHRYSSGYENYRRLVSRYRTGDMSEARKTIITKQIFLYKKRFELMRTAMRNGVFAPIVLMVAIISVP